MILISKICYLPQWIILSVDMGMVFCGCLGYILLKVIGVGFELNMHFNVIVLLYLTTTIFLFWIFRTYSSDRGDENRSIPAKMQMPSLML
jgi:hypothetical protein